MRPVLSSILSTTKAALGRARWGIAIYTGTDPLTLSPAPGVPCPVLTRHSVTDARASLIADPFMIRVSGGWHMFFEVLKVRPHRDIGVIAHASSPDGLTWRYDRVVLEEGTHLSYPQVFESGGEIFMVPESRAAGCVRLFRADPFPHRWVFAAELLREPLLDPTLFERDGAWWMYGTPRIESDMLQLFHAPALTGPWREHPLSPVVRGDRRTSRPAGRVLVSDDRVLRLAQDCVPAYGTAVRAFDVTALSRSAYAEREAAPGRILGPGTGMSWNRRGMHHADIHRRDDGSFVACVDGWYRGLVDARELATRAGLLP